MSDPYVGEIRILPYTFAPRGWSACQGQLLPISQNTALFSILGTMYGGDGRSTFALPDMRGRAPIHHGRGPGLTPRTQGQRLGVADVTLTESQMPTHNHSVRVAPTQADQDAPSGHYLADAGKSGRGGRFDAVAMYSTSTSGGQMASQALGTAGGSQAHQNMQPYLGIQFCISLFGVYPSHN
ncbi:phage tail protein [Rhodovibrio sodomensis]|uniref:Phage tail protein n=1 Tax=Rhodovibrio sodomensis TaxID=1088 RepID=A0ABS1DIR7_9PROT|nr:tail fiber protein [Rhodovibrio sodomensis]MBK1670380.1 phage tail protein [Rhodovibrio sodomensis]